LSVKRTLSAAGVALGLLLAGCSQSLNSEGPVVIHDNAEYQEASLEAEQLSKDALPKKDADQDLTETDRSNLRKALRLYEGMSAYLTTNPLPSFTAGQIYQVLGDQQTALTRFQQYLDATAKGDSDAAKVTRADAHYLRSVSFFKLKDYKSAIDEVDVALAAFPGTPGYLIQRASTYTQLGKKKEALDDLSDALSADPQNRRAQGLYKFLSK
jgi:tetratricopeptide (TPR) repeat protein